MSDLPPPDQSVFFASSQLGQLGPVTFEAICDEIVAGRVPEPVQIAWQGSEGWVDLVSNAHMVEYLNSKRGIPTVPVAEVPPEPVVDQLDEEMDEIFGQLVRASWEHHKEAEFAAHIDDVVVGAMITGTLHNGFSLIDVASTGDHHYLRFEEVSSKARMTVALTHLTESAVSARVLGQRASVVIGYGEPVAEFAKVWQAVKADWRSGFSADADPGTITVDADPASGYIYCQVDLHLAIDDYVGKDWSVNHPLLATHVGATVNALRKYLAGRLAG